MDRIRFDVSGHMFAIRRDLLMGGPDTRLKELGNTDQDVVVLDRPPDVFGAILTMYQTGELHIPKTCCPGTFLLELDYWNIKQEKVASCCFFRLQRFENQQENLKKFQRNLQLTLNEDKRAKSVFPSLNHARDKLWSVVDYKEKTALSKIYFAISLCMVLISTCNLAVSTHPQFRRNMTNCERYNFMVKSAMEGTDLVADKLKADCENTTGFLNVSSDDTYLEINVSVTTTPASASNNKTQATDQSHEIEHSENGTNQNGIDHHGFSPSPKLKRIKIPNFKIPIQTVKVIDLSTTIYFSVDICLRLCSCPSLLRYVVSLVNLADAVALLGTYSSWIIICLRPKEEYEENWLDLLEYLQMLRSFRLFRLVMTFNISKVLVYSIEHTLKDGFIMILVLIAGMCTFSTCLYLSEDKDTVRTIPDAWYWSVITMATVGYGDIVPKTLIGKVVACLCSICGLLVFSMSMPLFVNQFITLYQYADITHKKAETDHRDTDITLVSVVIDKKKEISK